MKKTLLLLLLCTVQCLHAQTFTKYWDKCYGGSDYEDFSRITTVNGQYLIIGTTSSSPISGNKTVPLCSNNSTDIWLVKADINGNILWDRDFGGGVSAMGNGGEILGGIIPLDDKILFMGYSDSDSSCTKSDSCRGNTDYWIGLVDSSGNLLWNKTYGGTDDEIQAYGFISAARMTNGNILLCGSSTSDIGGDKTVPNYTGANSLSDVWVLMLDSTGNKLWDKGYGSVGNDEVVSAINDGHDNFVLACNITSEAGNDISDSSRGYTDLWLLKIDSLGNKLWDKRYGGIKDDIMYDIKLTRDSGYIITGATLSPQGLDVSEQQRGMRDVWIIKTDANGNKQWDKRFGGSSISASESKTVENYFDGGYVIGGLTTSDSSNDVSETNYGVWGDYWILKIDSVGNKQWDKRYGGPDHDYAYDLTLLPDSSIVIVGDAEAGLTAVKTDSGYGDNDCWAVRFKYNDPTVNIRETENISGLTFWPNPTGSELNIKSNNAKDKATITVYDQLGKVVYLKQNTLLNTTCNLSGLVKGVYYLQVSSDKTYLMKKIVKM